MSDRVFSRLKLVGGALFSGGCIIIWTALIAPHVTSGLVQTSGSFGGAVISVFGFSMFFMGWILEKLQSSYGRKYWDWEALKIAKVMGGMFGLTLIIWIGSLVVFQTKSVFMLFRINWPSMWILGFLVTFILMGAYMRRIRAGRTYQKPLGRKILGVLSTAFSFLIVFAVIVGLGAFAYFAWTQPLEGEGGGSGFGSEDFLPSNYYESAENYVMKNYGNVSNVSCADLDDFLMKIDSFPKYDSQNFSCSEASARLEWILEGAGFHTWIATSEVSWVSGHAWVLVELGTGENVAIEATRFTSGDIYTPPGIIIAPDGSFKKHSWEYQMFQEWKNKYPPSQYDYDPNMTLEEWKAQYSIEVQPTTGIPTRSGYYSPPNTYESPEEAKSE